MTELKQIQSDIKLLTHVKEKALKIIDEEIRRVHQEFHIDGHQALSVLRDRIEKEVWV